MKISFKSYLKKLIYDTLCDIYISDPEHLISMISDKLLDRIIEGENQHSIVYHKFFNKIEILKNKCASQYIINSLKKSGINLSISNKSRVIGAYRIEIGDNFYAQDGLRLEAIDEFCGIKYSPIIKIGSNVALHQNVHIGAINRIEIGNNVAIGGGVLITDHAHGKSVHDDLIKPPMSRQLYSKGPVIIGDNVWIGENVSILPGVVIGTGSVIGANSLINKSIPPYSVFAGNPARLLKN